MIDIQEDRKENQTNVRKTILICDDELDLLLMFQIHLESQYEVLTVESATAYFDKVTDQKKKKQKIDLVLLDYKLRYFR